MTAIAMPCRRNRAGRCPSAVLAGMRMIAAGLRRWMMGRGSRSGMLSRAVVRESKESRVECEPSRGGPSGSRDDHVSTQSEAIPFGITVLIAAGLALLAWRRRGRGLSRPWSPAFARHDGRRGGVGAVRGPGAGHRRPDRIKQVCFALRVAGATTMLLGMLAFVLRYTGCDRWLAPRRFAAVAAPMLALTLLAWTNPWHHLYWRSIGNERIGEF